MKKFLAVAALATMLPAMASAATSYEGTAYDHGQAMRPARMTYQADGSRVRSYEGAGYVTEYRDPYFFGYATNSVPAYTQGADPYVTGYTNDVYDAKFNNAEHGFYSIKHGEDNYHKPSPANAPSGDQAPGGGTWTNRTPPAEAVPGVVGYRSSTMRYTAPMQTTQDGMSSRNTCRASVRDAVQDRFGSRRVTFMKGMRMSVKGKGNFRYSCTDGQVTIWKK